MKEIAIVYSSKTGNTEKVARALQAAAAERCDIFRADGDLDLDGYKLIFVGYWLDRGEPDAVMKQLLPRLENKKVVLFQTLGAEPYSEHGMVAFANAGRFLGRGCKVLGVLSVRGAIDPQLIAAMRKAPAGSPHAPTPEAEARWAAASTHPDAADLADAAAYMKKFLGMYDKFYKFM